MMNEFIVKVEKSTRMVDLPKNVIGNDMENLQEKLIFKFTDEFVNGQARLEYKIGSTKNYIVLSKENDTYTMPIKNILTKEGKIEMQLVITETSETEEIPVFKSNVFYLYCNKSINAVNEAPDGYELWIETANAKLNLMDEALTEVDNLDIDANKVDTTTTIEITKKDGTKTSVDILDGEKGDKGDNATINGVNTLNIVEGDNIELIQNGSTLTINNTYEYDDTDVKQDISTNTSNISQNTTDIATLNSNLVNYSLITETGSKLAITIDNSTYQMYITLKDKNDNVIHTSNTIDLPIEQLVMNVTYDNTNKAIVITLQNGNVTSVPVGALIDGLVSNDDLNTTLADYVKFTDYANDTKAGVVKNGNGILINSNGYMYGESLTYSLYNSKGNQYFLTKGTLENVITGKDLTTKSYVDGLVGDIDSVLDAINGEVI